MCMYKSFSLIKFFVGRKLLLSRLSSLKSLSNSKDGVNFLEKEVKSNIEDMVRLGSIEQGNVNWLIPFFL